MSFFINVNGVNCEEKVGFLLQVVIALHFHSYCFIFHRKISCPNERGTAGGSREDHGTGAGSLQVQKNPGNVVWNVILLR